MKHFGVYAENEAQVREFLKKVKTNQFIPDIGNFEGLAVLEYSEDILQAYIAEDHKHGSSILVQNESRSLKTFSSGEKRKLLLHHLLKKQPEVLILDEPFGCLDQESVKSLQNILKNHQQEITYIQLFRRKTDLLASINWILETGTKNRLIAREKFFDKNFKIVARSAKIPDPISTFENVSESLIKMRNVSVSYEDQKILQNINWEVRQNEFWKLSGPNGSGKTTILSMIYGDNPKAFGTELYIFGNRKGTGETVWEIKEKIGYFSPSLTEMFQKRNSVLEMVISGFYDSIGLYLQASKREEFIAREWLKVIGLAAKENAIFFELSHTDKRLVLIARAMIKHPPLLILDEPSTGLDDKGARKLTALINQIAAESRTAIIYVSHRSEPGLNPDLFFELEMTENGSIGKIL